MLKSEKEKTGELKIEQEEVNKKLLEIARNLKNIPNISLNYMEYMAALIYVMYENRDELNDIILDTEFRNNSYLLRRIDYKLEEIRTKEKSEKLFRNLSFLELINQENNSTF